jgi:Rhs element Vgr protein
MGSVVEHQDTFQRRDDHEKYYLEVLGKERLSGLSVVSFCLVERMGEPYRIDIVATHPLKLTREVILANEARFSMEPGDGSEARLFCGRITRFSHTNTTHDLSSYEIVVEPHIGCLTPRTTQTYQNQSAPDVIKSILQRNGLNGHQFSFRLRRQYPKHPFRFQYQTGDWRYINILMQQEGIYSYIARGKVGDVVVFGDDIDHYVYTPILTAPARALSGLMTGDESVSILRTHTEMVPESFVVADYNPQQAWERLKDEANVAPQDSTTYGRPYVYGTHHLDQDSARWEAQLRHEAALAWQVVYEGESNVHELGAGRILRTDIDLPDAPHGMVMIEVTHTGARDKPYHNAYKAIPANRRFRLKIEDDRWPKITGTLSARVTSPGKYKYAYLTRQGYYVVRFDCDFGDWPAGAESVPLRLAKPFAGGLQTGFHFPALDGTEAVISFHEGNPNKPFIAAFHHDSQHVDLITSQERWLSRNVIRTQSDNKVEFEDWRGEEHARFSTPHSGKSHLVLGHIVSGKREHRGSGFELRTSGYGAVRGGSGLLLTGYNRPQASGKQLDMQETIAQLREMLTLAESLAQSAQASKATPADTVAQKSINDALDELEQPGALVTAPGPVGVVSGDGVQLAADGSIIATAKKGVHFSTLKRFTVAARDVVSVFTQKGMSLIAAAGAVVVQAQRGSMQLASQEDMSVESVNGVVHVKAAKEIILNVNGTYVKISGGGVEIGSRGGVLYRTAGVKGTGPAQMDLSGAAFAPAFVPYTTACEVWRTNPGFVPPPAAAPAPDALQWQSLGNTGAVAPAPAADGCTTVPPSFLGDMFSGKSGAKAEPSSNGGLTIHDPDNAPTEGSSANPEPIELENPASCNWQLSDFTASATMQRETPTYQKYGWTRTERLVKDGRPVMCAGTAPTTCQFTYDSSTRTLTAKVVTALIPRLLVKMNPATREPMRDQQNNYVVVQYETFGNGANSGKSFAEQGLMLVERDPGEIDASTYKNMTEKTLNQGNYKLILDGCNKGAACGCRVAVKFCADVHVVRAADAPALNPNIIINLYPTTERADAANWPEKEYVKAATTGRYTERVTQTKVHETGHLFNFPDEYWEQGGFVHSMYVKDGRDIDFSLADAHKATNKVWVIETENNLMGGGCLKPTATTSPYYLEYIRRWFSAQTNKLWRVGYNAPVVTATKTETSGASAAAKTGADHVKK